MEPSLVSPAELFSGGTWGLTELFSNSVSRRSIQNKTANTYVCRKIKECQITSKTRKTCQYCR